MTTIDKRKPLESGGEEGRSMKHYISLGAGVQSSTMALMFACGELTPMPDAAIFADTKAEPQSVYHWLTWLQKRLPFPVHIVAKGNLADDQLAVHHRKDNGESYIRTMRGVGYALK